MQLSSISIKNFRNINNLEMNFSQIEMILGENNIGKTNILMALKKSMNGKYFSVYQEDFGDISESLIIKISFSNLNETEQALFYDPEGLFNPLKKEIKIQFEAVINNFGEIDRESHFLREDKEDLADKDFKIKKFIPSDFKNSIPFYNVSTDRSIKDSISKNGDLFNILKSFKPENGSPTVYFEKKLYNLIDELKQMIIESNFKFKEDIDFLIHKNWSNQDLLNENKFFENLTVVKESTEEKHIIEKTNEVILFSTRLKKALISENHLNNTEIGLKELMGLENIEKQLFSELKNMGLEDNIKLNTILTKENIFNLVSMEINEISIFNQGDGYRNILNLLIKLTSLYISAENNEFDERKPYLIILTIDEPELYLHPHLQRSLIKQLKKFQDRFFEIGITLQIISSTHSSFIISPLEIENLTFIRKYGCNFFPIKIYQDEFKSEPKINKHLKTLLINYSEVFFSRFVIIGEGKTEKIVLPIFAEKLNMDFDDKGISFLNSGGEGNISHYEKIINRLNIDYAILVDKDKSDDYPEEGYIFISGETGKEAFEKEIINSVDTNIILNELSNYEDDTDKLNYMKSKFQYIKGYNPQNIVEAYKHIKNNDKNKCKKIVFKWLKKKKGDFFWIDLSNSIPKNQIPSIYNDLISFSVNSSSKVD